MHTASDLNVNTSTDPTAAVDLLVDHLTRTGLADNTIVQYRAGFMRWWRWAVTAGHDPAAPTAAAVRGWSDTEPRGVSSRDTCRAAIRHWAAASSGDPAAADAVLRPEKNARRPRRALSYEDAAAVHQTAHSLGLAGTAVLVGLYTGFRRSEIAALHWDGCDLDGRRPTIRVWREKQDAWFTVPAHPALVAHLLPARPDGDAPPGYGWVFPGRHGGHISPATVSAWVARVADAAGVGHVSPHQLRKTAATMLYDLEHDLMAVRAFLGHAKVTTTQAYVNLDVARIAGQVSGLSFELVDAA
jgi:integrase